MRTRHKTPIGGNEALHVGAKPGGTGTRGSRRWVATILKGEIDSEREMGAGRCDDDRANEARNSEGG